jgi:hypothetical protein
MITMAMRCGCGVDGEDFELVFICVLGDFAMLSQYTAKTDRGSACRISLGAWPLKGRPIYFIFGIATAMP